MFPFLNNTHTAQSNDPYFASHWANFNDHFIPTNVVPESSYTPSHPASSDNPHQPPINSDSSLVVSPQTSSGGSPDVSPGSPPPDYDTLTNLEPDSVSTEPEQLDTRRSTRNRQTPYWWNDYSVGNSKPSHVSSVIGVKHSMDNYLSPNAFTPEHAAFLAKIVHHQEPKSFAQAVLDPN